MVDIASKTSRYCWAFESTPGDPEITIATSTTYEFGNYNAETEKWATPFVENNVEPYYTYDLRTPKLIEVETKYPSFQHVFLPTSPVFMNWMLGKATSATPSATMTVLDEGEKYPITIRNEELLGTYPQLTQAIGCYCIGTTVKGERGKSLIAECEFAWQSLEDYTNDARAFLTTDPVMPTMLLDKSYNGNPIVVWDVGVGDVDFKQVWKADFNFAQEWEYVHSDEGTVQTINCYKHEPVKIILSAVFETHELWDDYINRVGTYEMSVEFKKMDNTSSILFLFENCRVQSLKKSGHRNEGHYGAIATLIAEKCTVTNDWFTESGGAGGDFTTHFRGVVT